ncbi:right-handed parallel beta-helix repeat-containing protein [Amycolatopsis sp. cmx-11-32]|uniref:right-handed parallel beta-helix repeat-containing protein n=1 Tax=Amycolatopsis sp. cmx-11-32 TaxID=2785796 RepID=UPI0039E2334B
MERDEFGRYAERADMFLLGKIALSVVSIMAAGLLTAGVSSAEQRPHEVPPPVSGRTLTVGPHGEYSTVQAAADAARPGDNVQLEAGVHAGGLTIKTSGSPGEYITFYGEGGTAVIHGRGGPKGLLALGSHSWLRFHNMTFAGSRGFGAYASGAHNLVFQDFGIDGSQDGGLVLLNTSDVVVDGCEIQRTNARGTSADHEALTLGHGSRDVEVKHCRVHDNGEEGIDVKYTDNARVSIHDNVSSNNRGPNIYVDSSSDVEIYNNVSSGTRNETKSGIALAVEDASESREVRNVKVYNNVSYGNAQAGLSFWVESSGTISGVQIVNNTFHDNAEGSIAFYGGDFEGTNILRNNIFAEGPASHDDFVDDHNISGDPGFVDPDAGDFHLKPGSARAVDQGSADSAPAFDLDSKPRPTGAGHDIGAYEQ